MEPVKPLSIKFDPEARKQIKKIAFLLDWPEGHFVKASVSVVLDMIEDRLVQKTVPRTVFFWLGRFLTTKSLKRNRPILPILVGNRSLADIRFAFCNQTAPAFPLLRGGLVSKRFSFPVHFSNPHSVTSRDCD